MNKLTREIRAIENKLNNEEEVLQHDNQELAEDIHAKHLLTYLIISGFAVGFLWARNKSTKHVVGSAIKTTFKLSAIYQQIKMFLPFI